MHLAVWLTAGVVLSSCSTLPNTYKARLADHLTETGAKMYGAYWCPHCATQKAYFDGVVNRLPYVECDPRGYNTQAALCEAEGIEAYPTWVIEGERYLGAQRLGRLAVLSGFETDKPLAEEDHVPAGSGGYSAAD